MRVRNVLTGGIIIITVMSFGCGGGEQQAEKQAETVRYLAAEFTQSGAVRTSEVRTFEGQSLYEYINGGAEFYHQYDFEEVSTTDYKHHGVELVVDIYQFANPDGAYGLYSMMRPDYPEIIQLGMEGFTTTTSLDFVKGRFLVRLTAYEETDETSSAMHEVAETIEKLVVGTTKQPQMFSLFPKENRIAVTGKIYAESFLGRDFLNDVYTQDYTLDGDTVTLFVSDDAYGEVYVQWSGLPDIDSVTTAARQLLPYDDKNVLSYRNSFYGEIVAGLRGGKLVGIINYNSKHQDFVVDWIESL